MGFQHTLNKRMHSSHTSKWQFVWALVTVGQLRESIHTRQQALRQLNTTTTSCRNSALLEGEAQATVLRTRPAIVITKGAASGRNPRAEE